MKTKCSLFLDRKQAKLKKNIALNFEGGNISSDGGLPLLSLVESKYSLFDRVAAAFSDFRDPDRITHSVRDLIAQRILAIALGYEDLNDHDSLSKDSLLACVVGKQDLSARQDQINLLASSSTLNRLELTSQKDFDQSHRYHKIRCNSEKLEKLFVDLFIESYESAPDEIILDLDHTDNPIHGKQEGRFFHGYYDCYCYLPLYVFCGEQLLVAKLRTSDGNPMRGVLEEMKRVIRHIRKHWPNTKIILRGDSGFCREQLMSWSEDQENVSFVFGLARNNRLLDMIYEDLELAEIDYILTEKAQRRFVELEYKTRESWSCSRRVVAKAEHLEKGSNPRFIVTNLPKEEWPGKELYEETYCARGEMENKIKEQQLYLFADRTSAGKFEANQLRLWFSSLAYVLFSGLRRMGLKGTELEKARSDTIRLKLLKLGAQVKVTVRRLWLKLSSSYPFKELFRKVWKNLTEELHH
jgi:hypothetical protein